MDKVAQYFSELGRGGKILNVRELQENIGVAVKHHPPSLLIRHFWQASRAASLHPDVHVGTFTSATRKGNIYMANQMQNLHSRLESSDLKPDDLGFVLATYGRLQTIPHPEFMTTWLSCSQKKMSEFSPELLKKLPEKLSALGIYPGDEWIDAWWDVARPTIGKWDLQDGYSVLYRLTLLDFIRSRNPKEYQQTSSPCRKIAEEFLGFIDKSARRLFTTQIDRKVFLAAKWFGYDFIDDYKVEPETAHASRAEAIFAEMVSRKGITVEADGILVPRINHKIDHKLVNGQTHGAEVDGICHFLRLPSSDSGGEAVVMNASTRFQSWLTCQFSPDLRVLRVPYFHIGMDKDLPWNETLEKLDQKSPAVYTYHGGNWIRNIADQNGFVFRNQPL